MFHGYEYDGHKYQASETGFSDTATGDSGNPYWAKINRAVNSDETVNAIVAVHGGRYIVPPGPRGAYLDNESYQCRGYATKVTDHISKWTMKLHDWAEALDKP